MITLIDRGELQFFAAASLGNEAALRQLNSVGADMQFPNFNEQTPLFAAVDHGHYACADYLLRRQLGPTDHDNDDINRPDCIGRTPLHAAAENNDTQMIELLLDPTLPMKADINAIDDDFCTPVWLAAEKGNVEAIDKLAHYKCDLTLVGKRNENPAEVAERNGHQDAVETLARHGCKPPSAGCC